MKILVIIPCYNEEENLERVVARLQKEAPQVDFLIVNDCSTDSSAAICKANGWRFLDLPSNLGIGGGVQSGYQYAVENDYDITVQMDGDGQHDPAYLEAVLAPVIAGELDMAVGSRFITKEGFQTSFMRRLGIRIISATIRLVCGAKVRDVTSGFRACGKKLTAFYARSYAQDYPEPEAIVSAVLNGYRVGEVPVVMQERMGGVSSINLLRSAYYMIKVPLALLVYRLSIRRKAARK
ncbi:MAG: glycosyltransferase family 2 protein [Oscillospiraceae bacterium]|nr:glycosyltransferase family 2 protein [Oscillospiraceae bacterium]